MFYDLATCLLLKYLNKAIEGLQDYFGTPSKGAVHHGGVFEAASYIVTAVWKPKVVNISAWLSLRSQPMIPVSGMVIVLSNSPEDLVMWG